MQLVLHYHTEIGLTFCNIIIKMMGWTGRHAFPKKSPAVSPAGSSAVLETVCFLGCLLGELSFLNTIATFPTLTSLIGTPLSLNFFCQKAE